jgi:hypothetical protein
MPQAQLQSVKRDINAWAVEVMHGVSRALEARRPAVAAPVPRLVEDELRPAA